MRTALIAAGKEVTILDSGLQLEPSGAMQLAASRPATSRVGLPRQRLSCGKESVLTHPEFLISWPTDRISLTEGRGSNSNPMRRVQDKTLVRARRT